MTAIKYKEGGTWKTLTMPSAVHIGASAPDEDIKQIWVDTDEGYAPSNYIAPLVSVLPTAPFDGQEVRYQNSAMATDGVVWTLRYRAASLSAYKWEFVGGSPFMSFLATTVQYTTAAFGDTTGTPGPDWTSVLPGEYRFEIRAHVHHSLVAGYNIASVQVGATAPTTDDVFVRQATTAAWVPAASAPVVRTVPAATLVRVKWRVTSDGGTGDAMNRALVVTPVRVG